MIRYVMVDTSAIAEGVTALKGLYEMASGLMKATSDLEQKTQVSELLHRILEAQNAAISAKEQQHDMLARIKELEDRISTLQDWEREKERYTLARFGREGGGYFAYVLRKSHADGNPPHALCPQCFENGKKSFLQYNGKLHLVKYGYTCNSCGLELLTQHDDPPEYAD